MLAKASLIRELEAGIRSAEEQGWISADDFRNHFRSKKEMVKSGQKSMSKNIDFEIERKGKKDESI